MRRMKLITSIHAGDFYCVLIEEKVFRKNISRGFLIIRRRRGNIGNESGRREVRRR